MCVAAAALIAGVPLAAACGSGAEAGVVNLYAPPGGDAAAPLTAVAKECSKDGGYNIVVHSLPKGADDQRLQLARRLAGNDSGIDVMTLDVTWTPEFANAGWIVPVPDDLAKQVEGQTLGGPLETAQWQASGDTRDRLYAVPSWTNTQLLWYRPDVLKQYVGANAKAPTTWDELLAQNRTIAEKKGPSYIEVTAAQYEGLVVWFTSLLASAGGQVVSDADPDKVTLTDTPEHRAATVRALSIMKAVATAPGSDPSFSNLQEGTAQQGMESGKATFQLNWPFVYATMRSNSASGSVAFLKNEMSKYADLFAEDAETPDVTTLGPVNKAMAGKFAFARYPGIDADHPARATIGGFNLAVSDTSEHKDLAFRAVQCLTTEKAQRAYAIDYALPPAVASLYDDSDVKKAYPMAADLRAQLETGHVAVRAKTPVYQSISTLLAAKLSPPGAWDPNALADELTTVVNQAIKGEGLIP